MANFERKVLVLDSRYEPSRILSMKQGFILLYSNRATSVVESERLLQGVNRTWSVPWIIKLNNAAPKSLRHAGLRFSRGNVYLRDGHTCRYCGISSGAQHLTLDHLLPLARGGKTTWENIVTACRPCNAKKGSKTVDELGIVLEERPFRPHLSPHMVFALRYNLHGSSLPEAWLSFIDLRTFSANIKTKRSS